ncbi:hypothetical protein TKK_0005649 [Trichogramma kaykai]|uniref:Methionine--tRNA ligase, cytoplasmic n=1 Tax=Trichogramma kaykai TaxID=54128 RepID=A0ABD2XHW9_9HYME
MKVLSNPNNPNLLKLVIAASISGKKLKIDYTAESKQSSFHRLPILKDEEEGIELFSLSAAVQYLAPLSTHNSVIANRWLEWEACQLLPAITAYGGTGKIDLSHKPRVWSLLKELDSTLKNSQYLIQEESDINVVDSSIWVTLWSTLIPTKIGEVIPQEFPNVNKWLLLIENLPIIQQSLKKVTLERGLPAIVAVNAVSWYPINSYSGSEKPQSKTSKISEVTCNEEKEDKAVSQEELNSVKNNWTSVPFLDYKESPYPVLPKKDERNVLITSALPYVNNVPHLGNIIGCVLSADIFARYCRQRNYNTLYISGTDEYGTATEAKALEEKLTPQQICDKYFNIHNDIYRWFSIGFDYFGRTTTPEQTEIVQAMFLRIKETGYVISNSVDQLLCEKCDRFLADRFVEGVCPGCKYEDARGDQCDGCGHLVNATELINPRCKVCSTTPIIKASTQFFLDLPKIQNNLKEWANKVEDGWTPVARAVTKPWLRDGLKPRCITRDLKWGIPVPLDGYRNKVFYVWFDAPIGYLSITKKYTKEYEKWWKPKDSKVDLYQFMAKDNVPFHAIMFPATLMAANEGHTLVKHIMATEYLNYEDTKFSKSRGIGVFGTDARDTGIPADVWRFYLAYIRPETMDSNFNWIDLATKNNSELLNNLGNFINRALSFADKTFNGTVPAIDLKEDDLNFLALAQRELTSYINLLEQARLRDALKHVLMISKHGNQYMQYQQPWVKVKGNDEDKQKGATVIGLCCNIACLLASLIGPFMPNTARELRSQLGLSVQTYGYIPNVISLMIPCGHKLGKPKPLFAKIEDKQVEELRQKYAGKQNSEIIKKNNLALDNAAFDKVALEAAIEKQGNLVRELKAKGDKSVWQPEVNILLDLKKKLANLASSSKAQTNTVSDTDASALEAAIQKQGNLVRELKAKGDKSVWQPEVNILLDLKKKLANLVASSPKAQTNTTSNTNVSALEAAIQKQGNLVRELKAKGDKSVWQPQVDILLDLKKQLEALKPSSTATSSNSKKSKNKK